MFNEAVVEKIRKCLALANGRNATQGEMENALAKAKAIAMKHGIELSSVSMTGNDADSKSPMEITKGTVSTRAKNPQRYHRWICAALQNIFEVRVVHCHTTYFFIGEVTDVEICKVLFPWLEDVFYSTYYAAMKSGRIVSCAASKNGVYSGLYNGLIKANKQAEATLAPQEAQQWALVVRNKADLVKARTEQEFPDLRKARNIALSSSATAFHIGYAKGSTMNLRNQVGGSGANAQIN